LATQWDLIGFMNALREWMRHDPPPGPLLIKATEFGAELEHNPEGGDIEIEYGYLFHRTVPGTEHDGRIVAITFSLEGSPVKGKAGQVNCQNIGCVPHPQQQMFLEWPPPRHH
jgi:hypothetical protein